MKCFSANENHSILQYDTILFEGAVVQSITANSKWRNYDQPISLIQILYCYNFKSQSLKKCGCKLRDSSNFTENLS